MKAAVNAHRMVSVRLEGSADLSAWSKPTARSKSENIEVEDGVITALAITNHKGWR